MAYKLIFIRRSNVSFKVYVGYKHKIVTYLIGGESHGLKLGRNSAFDIFVVFKTNRKLKFFLRNSYFYNNCILEFNRFVKDNREKFYSF